MMSVTHTCIFLQPQVSQQQVSQRLSRGRSLGDRFVAVAVLAAIFVFARACWHCV